MTANAPRMGKRPRAKSRRTKETSGPLQYKVVELSSVDEASLEQTLNQWASQGWTLDGIQFAMRDSSKRPSMAFVLFTRHGKAALSLRDEGLAKLQRLAESDPVGPRASIPLSAHDRLRQLAGEFDE